MLTLKTVNQISKRLNLKFNIKFVGEKVEQRIFSVAVFFILNELEELGLELSYIINKDSSIDLEGLEELKPEIVRYINDAVNVPFLSEKKEAKYIQFIMDEVIAAFEKGKRV
jgi:hypothetical protein